MRAPADAFDHWVHNIYRPEGPKNGYSVLSIRQFSSTFGRFCDFMEGRGVHILRIDAAGVSDFLGNMPGRHPGEPGRGAPPARHARASTFYRYDMLLSDVMDHLVARQYRKHNPMFIATRNAARGPAEGRLVFLPAQVDERLQQYLLEEMPTDTWEQRRSRALMLFILGSGVIASEAGGALMKEFAFNDVAPGYDVPAGPSRPAYRALLSPFCVQPLREWLDERRHATETGSEEDCAGSPLAFPKRDGSRASAVTVYLIVRGALRAIDFPGDDMGARVLRTTYARRQILAGATVPQVMAAIGVRNEKSLFKLLRLTPTHTGFIPA